VRLGADAGVGPVAPDVACPAAPSLELGLCMRDATTPCTGAEGEPRQLVDHVAGGEVPLVVGEQGLSMVVFGARTRDIALGDAGAGERGHPALRVGARVDAVTEVARYDGYPAFEDAGGGAAIVNGLFLVVLASGDVLDHLAVDVEATLIDRDGAVRCGVTSMVLVPAP
jgi:hypothetical protein